MLIFEKTAFMCTRFLRQTNWHRRTDR